MGLRVLRFRVLGVDVSGFKSIGFRVWDVTVSGLLVSRLLRVGVEVSE